MIIRLYTPQGENYSNRGKDNNRIIKYTQLTTRREESKEPGKEEKQDNNRIIKEYPVD